MKDEDQRKHDNLIAWSALMFCITLVTGISINVNAQSSQQSGTACVNGSQYCENNSLDTVNTTTTTNTNTNTNTNQNTNTNTNTNANTNVSTNTNNSTNTNSNTNNSTNSNTNVNTSTSNNTNTNNNVNTSTSTSNSTVNSTVNQNVNNTKSDNTNRNINESNSTQTINQNVKSKAPPASAIAPSIMSYSQDLCTVGRSGAYQGQVFGFSTGRTVTDTNCERLKLSKYLYDTGMKVASVSILCQDPRVFKAMEMAGTPCPYQGQIGKEAEKAWSKNKSKRPDAKEQLKLFIKECTYDKNPNRDNINKDVVGLVKKTYTTKTKTKRQCKKEFYATQ